eukprot:12252641-Alexandrium_andersonii.AAC.1
MSAARCCLDGGRHFANHSKGERPLLRGEVRAPVDRATGDGPHFQRHVPRAAVDDIVRDQAEGPLLLGALGALSELEQREDLLHGIVLHRQVVERRVRDVADARRDHALGRGRAPGGKETMQGAHRAVRDVVRGQGQGGRLDDHGSDVAVARALLHAHTERREQG